MRYFFLVCSDDHRVLNGLTHALPTRRTAELGATHPMLLLNQIYPIAVQLGPLAVHWYGLMYLLGFAVAWYLGQRRIRAGRLPGVDANAFRSEEHTSELQSLMRISYAGYCVKKNNTT